MDEGFSGEGVAEAERSGEETQGWGISDSYSNPMKRAVQSSGILDDVCWACSAVWACESAGRADGGEELAKRKGGIAR